MASLPTMPITYRGRQYFTARRAEACLLARQLGIHERIAELYANDAAQRLIDRALWERILDQVGKGVLAGGAE